MTYKVLRDVTDMIRRGGGSSIRTRPGGKHTKVVFLDGAGVERWVTIHHGSNGKRYEDCMRSQLRRRGLNL